MTAVSPWETLINSVAELGPPFTVRSGPGGPGSCGSEPCESDPCGPENYGPDPADAVWFCSSDLADPAGERAVEMVALHAQSRGLPPARHAASLAFQRYCHRVCGVAVGAWVLGGVALDLSAERVAVRFVDATPDLVELAPGDFVPDAGPEHVLASVYDDHLLLVARAISGRTGPGLGNLRGNIAAGFAGAFRNLSRRVPEREEVRELADRAGVLLACRTELARAGDFRLLEWPGGVRLEYDRKTCCHWYAAEGGRYCSWCSRLDHDERTRRFFEAACGG